MKRKHALIMILICALPVIGFAVAYFLGIPLGKFGIVALLLLCPLGHLIMMWGMGKNHVEHTRHDDIGAAKKS